MHRFHRPRQHMYGNGGLKKGKGVGCGRGSSSRLLETFTLYCIDYVHHLIRPQREREPANVCVGEK